MTPSLVAVLSLALFLLAVEVQLRPPAQMEVQGIEEGDIDGSLGLGRLFINGTHGRPTVPRRRKHKGIEMTHCCSSCNTELFEFIKRDYSFCRCMSTKPGLRPATQPAEENYQSARNVWDPDFSDPVYAAGVCEDYVSRGSRGSRGSNRAEAQYRQVHGRPFSVDGKYRTAGSETVNMLKHKEPWKIGESPIVSLSNPFNEEIGRYWLQHAEAEHASIASFAKHTLQLMSLGAPAKLLMASQAASIDEVQHAKICYNFASAFLGSDLGPGSMDVEGSLGSMEVKDIIRSLITEGCVGETLAAMEAHLAAKYAEDPAIKAALSQIALEETKHSQLAWDTIQWILQKFPDSQSFAEEVFNAELEEHLVAVRSNSSQPTAVFCQESEKEASFHRHGLLVKGDRAKVRQVGIKDIIEPIYTAGFKHVDTISKLITELDIVNL